MVTKLRAARLAARSGAHTLIASGETHDVLPRLLSQEDLGNAAHCRADAYDRAEALDRRTTAGQGRR
ncbi:MAG: hypothetical protein CM15mP120_28240 [Pseudomonadota bacterium]|nr:MAG: hypothetical protein CM15mP120_28240 [Pseudomonadota bacterium]